MSSFSYKGSPVRKLLFSVGIIAVILLFLSVFQDPIAHRSTPVLTSTKLSENSSSSNSLANKQSVVQTNSQTLNGKPFELEFLIPLTSTHFNFCRSLYTALINDYPKPTLINWGKVFENAPQARVRKINGIDDYLHRLRPDQYALIMDGFDVWYQTPYSDFVNRFLEITTKNNDYEVAIFGADKKCWPNDLDSPACVNVPESPLPKDAYGPDTDDATKTTNSRLRYINHRPRWLNSGNMIGPVKVLQQVYDRANHSITTAPPEKVFSDQMYIADVFGEQDLKMTVDYTSDLFQTMTFSHRDVIFLEDDLMSSPRKPPSERRLLAFNKISGALPPILHFNGPKEAMDIWWPKMWWYKERESPAVIAKSKEVYETGGAFTVDGQFISWRELCGDTDVHNPKGKL
ncbi:hypothetical protein V1514DRAFT_301609 [Lipomyces japonicus]|uniref:uncharacterized protein n=1 Tax=Lipomyces japonicus TaxID=56871 RepID=UPI0034CFEFDC